MIGQNIKNPKTEMEWDLLPKIGVDSEQIKNFWEIVYDNNIRNRIAGKFVYISQNDYDKYFAWDCLHCCGTKECCNFALDF